MRLKRQYDPSMMAVAFVPLVNVLFLVVLFFTLSSRFVVQPGLAVSLPPSPFAVGPRPDALLVSITAVPVPTIYFQDGKVELGELEGRLSASPVKNKSVIIRADRYVPLDYVTEVANAAMTHGFSVMIATELPR